MTVRSSASLATIMTVDVRLKPSETYSVRAGRPHLVTTGKTSATFLVLQGIGEYDFIPLV